MSIAFFMSTVQAGTVGGVFRPSSTISQNARMFANPTYLQAHTALESLSESSYVYNDRSTGSLVVGLTGPAVSGITGATLRARCSRQSNASFTGRLRVSLNGTDYIDHQPVLSPSNTIIATLSQVEATSLLSAASIEASITMTGFSSGNLGFIFWLELEFF